jgi:hypothetical protein
MSAWNCAEKALSNGLLTQREKEDITVELLQLSGIILYIEQVWLTCGVLRSTFGLDQSDRVSPPSVSCLQSTTPPRALSNFKPEWMQDI